MHQLAMLLSRNGAIVVLKFLATCMFIIGEIDMVCQQNESFLSPKWNMVRESAGGYLLEIPLAEELIT